MSIPIFPLLYAIILNDFCFLLLLRTGSGCGWILSVFYEKALGLARCLLVCFLGVESLLYLFYLQVVVSFFKRSLTLRVSLHFNYNHLSLLQSHIH